MLWKSRDSASFSDMSLTAPEMNALSATPDRADELCDQADELAAAGKVDRSDAVALRHALDYAERHPDEKPSFF